MNRPAYKSQQEMVDEFVALHNALVAPDDLVINCGDVCYDQAPDFLPQVERFNGRKVLIRGNHDRVFSDSDLTPYFESIIPEGDGIELDVDGLLCYATHYPHSGREDRFNIVGHIHSAWKFQLNMVNVGVDVNHFRPVELASMPHFLRAITEFYDDDVWVAYAPFNQNFKDSRGKKSNRLKEHHLRIDAESVPRRWATPGGLKMW